MCRQDIQILAHAVPTTDWHESAQYYVHVSRIYNTVKLLLI